MVNLLAQANNRFLVNAVFEINNGNITQPENYKLVSIPGDTTIALKSILTGEAGRNWMAFREDGRNYPLPYLSEDEEYFKFSPGKAFWIISKNNINLGPFSVKKVPLKNNTYSIPLNKGWNLISNPFDKSINWKDVRLLNNLQNDLIYYYYEGYYDNASVKMQPYLGYYFYNRKELDKLILPYPTNNQLSKSRHLYNYFKLSAIKNNDTSSIVIYLNDSNNSLYNNQLYPLNNFIQFGATIKLDDNYYSEVIIDPSKEFTKLPLVIINKNNEIVEYILERHIDEYYSNLKFLIKENSIITPLNNTPFHLNANANLEIFITDKDLNINNLSLPKEFIVSQNYPNPFNPTTNISITLPDKDYITINIFNSIGKKISTLFAGELSEGFHNFTFNGENLASGIYFYSVNSKYGTCTKKMVLLR
jgi:hypothetical protein